MRDDRMWGNIGLMLFGVISSIHAVSAYSKISRIERYGGSIRVNPLTRWVYETGGKDWVLGVGLAIGLAFIVAGLVRSLRDTSSPLSLDLLGRDWKHRDPSRRAAAVARLDELEILTDIATNDPIHFVRLAAVDRIGDQAVLADIATSDSDERVRLAAAQKIADRTVLGDIVKHDPSLYVSLVVIERIGRQKVLADIAENASNERVREAAIDRLEMIMKRRKKKKRSSP